MLVVLPLALLAGGMKPSSLGWVLLGIGGATLLALGTRRYLHERPPNWRV